MDQRLSFWIRIFCALVLSLSVFSRAGRAAQPSEYLVEQDDAKGLVLLLPQPAKYTAKIRGGHAPADVGGPRDGNVRRLARPSSSRAERVLPLTPGHGSALSAAKAIKRSDVLPGLPGALIAVMENSASGPSTSSSSARLPEVVPAGRSPAMIPAAPSGPVSLTATVLDDPDPSLRGLFFPFEAAVGAAAFSRGDDVLVVFDAARPFDLSGVQDDPAGAQSSIQLLPEATILRLRLHQAKNVVLRRFPAGWLIQANVPNRMVKAIIPVMDGGTLRLPVDDAGRTVIVPDPDTGGNLLVGTIRSGHDAVVTRRRGPAEVIEQTIQGVVVDPFSDRLELRSAKHAFLLSGTVLEAFDRGTGASSELEGGAGAGASRILALAAGSPQALYRRFKEAKAAAAAAPAEARFALRLLAAQDALALGDAEAAATITRVAVADDARQAAAVRPKLITAAAALLDHHPDAVDLLDEPQAGAEGDIGLWRAVKLAERDPASPEAARLFAGSLPLLRSYPGPLQAALLPLAALSLVRGGNDAQAALVDHLPLEHDLAFARAVLAERRGQQQAALTALDQLGLDPDVRMADQAVEEAVAIRRTSSGSDPRKLADILEGHLLDARIAGHDVASRFRLAEMRAQGGQWQKALDLLRETAALHPDQENETRRRAGQVLMRLAAAPLKSGDGEAFAQAATIETNIGLMPGGADGSRISLFLAAKLGALDLPERAAPIVRDMMRQAEPGVVKAELGLRLAELSSSKMIWREYGRLCRPPIQVACPQHLPLRVSSCWHGLWQAMDSLIRRWRPSPR